jgi:subtilisin family serine protease
MRKRRVILSMVGAVFACLLTPATLSADAGDQFIVKTANLEALQEFAAEHGAEVSPLITYPDPSKETMKLYGDQYIVRIPAEEKSTIDRMINGVECLPGVQSVQPDEVLNIYIPEWDEEPVENSFNLRVMNPPPYTPNDPRYPDQWDKPMTETNWAWNTTTGEGAGVAVLDQGVDTTHEDLVDNLYMGYDFNENDNDYYDIGGHGTQCCGVACAKIDNSVGIAGVAGNAHLMALKIWGDNPLYYSTLTNCMNYAIDNGVKAISMSWGTYQYNSSLESIMNNAWDRGAFLCGGAANDNTTLPFYPASFDKVMNVGATTSADERWGSSNYGPHVQIFAPGGLSTKRGGGYGGVQPTSFTTPQIAGLAALLWSAHPEYSNQQVWNAIILGADTLDSDVGKILRMNSNGALEADVSVAEQPLEAQAVSAASIQSGVIRFAAPASTDYSLRIFDVTGSQVYETNGVTDARGEVICNPDIGQGVYFWRFKASEGTSSGRFVYVR